MYFSTMGNDRFRESQSWSITSFSSRSNVLIMHVVVPYIIILDSYQTKSKHITIEPSAILANLT